MRTFTLVFLFALALAIVSFAPVASADANITLYADLFCTQSMSGGTTYIPVSSSPNCQDVTAPTGNGSAIFWCYNSGGYNNFSLSAWNTVSGCSGAADAVLSGYGKQDSCMAMTLAFSGQRVPVFAQLQCGTDSDSQLSPADMSQVVNTINVAKQAAVGQNKMGRLGMMARLMPRAENRQQQA